MLKAFYSISQISYKFRFIFRSKEISFKIKKNIFKINKLVNTKFKEISNIQKLWIILSPFSKQFLKMGSFIVCFSLGFHLRQTTVMQLTDFVLQTPI
jgi:hypothetical protein